MRERLKTYRGRFSLAGTVAPSPVVRRQKVDHCLVGFLSQTTFLQRFEKKQKRQIRGILVWSHKRVPFKLNLISWCLFPKKSPKR